jgi:hypothetical protein
MLNGTDYKSATAPNEMTWKPKFAPCPRRFAIGAYPFIQHTDYKPAQANQENPDKIKVQAGNVTETMHPARYERMMKKFPFSLVLFPMNPYQYPILNYNFETFRMIF